MPRALGALLLILLGIGVLAVAWDGYKRGEIPAGSKGLRAYRPNRSENPFAFRFYLAVYFAGGTALVVWGLLSMFGGAPALALR